MPTKHHWDYSAHKLPPESSDPRFDVWVSVVTLMLLLLLSPKRRSRNGISSDKHVIKLFSILFHDSNYSRDFFCVSKGYPETKPLVDMIFVVLRSCFRSQTYSLTLLSDFSATFSKAQVTVERAASGRSCAKLRKWSHECWVWEIYQ